MKILSDGPPYSGPTNQDYMTDEKWWNAVCIAEEARKKKGAKIDDDLAGGTTFGPDLDDDPEPETPSETGEPTTRADDAAVREPDPSLSGTFAVSAILGSPTLDVTGERVVNGRLPNGHAIQFAVAGTRAGVRLRS